MSPVALQDEAWTHFPPWQFVEQHSVAEAQLLPRVVQETAPPAMVTAAHCPPVHVPEQHCNADEQLWPTDAHAPLAHVPLVAPEGMLQSRLQQSAFAEQVAPAAAQNWVELHLWVVVLHAVEQQSAFVEQVSPPGWHAFGTGVVQVPLLH